MKFLRRLRSLFLRHKLDAEMTAEMRHHLELQAERNRSAGMDADEANYAAQRQFGNVASIQEQAREWRGLRGVEQISRALRFAARSLWKSPGYTITSSLMLVLGIGASTAIFTLVQSLLLSPLQYHESGNLVQLQSRHPEQGIADLAPATFNDVATGNHSFATLAAQYYYYVNLTGSGTPALLNSADVTADYFTLFGVAPALGRTWNAEDLKGSSPPVVVLGHALWRSQFHGSDAIVGRQILLDDVAYTVIGVMPASFKDPAEVAQLWRPMRPGADDLHRRNSRYWTVFGRLKSGVSLDRANLELATLGRRLQLAFPKDYEGWTLQGVDLHSQVIGDYRTGLLVVLGAVGCVLLIACANVTGLAIVRATARRKELAIRAALGSSRGQLVSLLLAENLLLALIGGAGGLVFAEAGVRAVLASVPEGWLPRADEIALNLPVLVASMGLTLLAGVSSGLVPGLAAARSDANEALKDCARGSAGRSVRRLRSVLIVGEIALALVLLAGTGLLGRSFTGLMRKKSGLDADRVLSLTISLSSKRYNSPARSAEFYTRAQAEAAAVPGVEAAGFTQTAPFRWGIPIGFTPVGATDTAMLATLPQAFTDSVSVDYFKAAGIPLRAGRLFTAADDAKAPPIVVISETAARRYFGQENPVGRVITTGGTNRFEVVGVVGDVRRSGLSVEIPLQVYRPLVQRPPAFATLMVRTGLPPATLAQSVQAALWRVDPDLPVTDIGTMETFVSRSVTQPRLYLAIFAFFAAFAVLIAAVGLYGLIAYSVAQRTREFGIRSALGANANEVLGLVLREGMVLIALGLTIGLTAAFLSSRLLQNMVYETSVHDPEVFLGVPIVLAATAVFACWLPARRAAKVDPVVALRAE